ncbi:MAG: FixH family protein [Candidatus Eremiobacteraeota bacterium]|nr:FixH family protein [Candidatus Eremiobacteraeota bacterium]
MKTIARFLLSLALLTGTPASAWAADSMKSGDARGKLVVSAAFTPAPPKKGFDLITVTVKDLRGKPVTGASVKISSNMPSMAMSGPTLVAREAGHGKYVVRANLNFVTTWAFDIMASAGAKSGSAKLTADVK